MNSAEPVIVGTIGFNIPCRRFLLTANVARDRRLSVVDEFVLRLLKLCEIVSAKRMAAYFGFSSMETEIVLNDLADRGLIRVDGNEVSLHPSAHEHFRGTEDGAPRVVEVDTWVDRVWFDLVSRNMMAPDRSRPLRNLIDVRSDESLWELPTAFARKAFEENFAEYLRKIRRISNPDRISLYSVSEVQPERFGSVVLMGREELVFDPEPSLRPQLFNLDINDVVRHRELVNAMNDAYRVLTRPDPSSSGLSDFVRLIGDASVEDAHEAKGRFDLLTWLSKNTSSPGSERRAIFGSSYLSRNVTAFSDLLNARLTASPPPTTSPEIQIDWFRPSGTFWGRSLDLQEMISRVKAVLRTVYQGTSIRTAIITPHAFRGDILRRFDRFFDEGYVAPAAYFSPSIEVLHVVGLAAIVLVAVPLSTVASTFVGYAVADSDSLQQIGNALDWDNVRQRAQQLWSRPQSARKEEAAANSDQLETDEEA